MYLPGNALVGTALLKLVEPHSKPALPGEPPPDECERGEPVGKTIRPLNRRRCPLPLPLDATLADDFAMRELYHPQIVLPTTRLNAFGRRGLRTDPAVLKESERRNRQFF